MGNGLQKDKQSGMGDVDKDLHKMRISSRRAEKKGSKSKKGPMGFTTSNTKLARMDLANETQAQQGTA
jgi:hypothetical protein